MLGGQRIEYRGHTDRNRKTPTFTYLPIYLDTFKRLHKYLIILCDAYYSARSQISLCRYQTITISDILNSVGRLTNDIAYSYRRNLCQYKALPTSLLLTVDFEPCTLVFRIHPVTFPLRSALTSPNRFCIKLRRLSYQRPPTLTAATTATKVARGGAPYR